MKLLLSIILFFTIGLINNPAQQPSLFKISIFKHVPDDMAGCGDAYYLSEKDKKLKKFICVSDLTTNLVNINGKPVRIAGEKTVPGKYSIIINELSNKQLDSEYYLLTAVITIKYGSKVIWQRKVIGEGGC